ncbi:MAG TPA: NifB/NifX family molybdenum-iron cluster-binding protein [Candidatus Omnitrophota bacterium]|jgi:predicted Fe-Mo cluster-binding NifX family protein|nr:MAG: Dinitrogenase iron-molybdenum cofactor [Candidatus Omnitrophica bacterium ADurb.Bin314]HOE69138.1 NifB/NifX family molybdenum-iron cluster-binding protein [Candidatus Omnitrophota bacterium]HQB94904.1 NifB/NifX family molybdenum-iron cluster-binding protein [Candidatus Omnitrophota bacterium]
MKVAITSEGKTPDAALDPRFGRCKYFLIFDSESGDFESLENSNAQSSGGAGVRAGQMMVSKGVSVVLTGSVGPNASNVLQSAGIKVYTGISGVVSEALRRFRAGEIREISA